MEENNENIEQEIDDKNFSDLMSEQKNALLDLIRAKSAYNKKVLKDTSRKTATKAQEKISNAAKKANLKLEKNSRNYDKTKEEIKEISDDYSRAINELECAYDDTSRENTLKLTELYGKKDELNIMIYKLNSKRNEYNKSKKVELKPLYQQLKENKKEAIKALKKGELEKADELVKIGKDLDAQISQEYENNPYNEKLAETKKEYKECKNQITEVKEYLKEIEKNFKDDCEVSLESKEQALANLENNKMFDKIKGFLSKSVLKNINKTKKFKENTLDPLKKNVKNFAESVPAKAEKLKENSKSKIKSIFSKGKETVINTKDKVVTKAQDTKERIEEAYSNGVSKVKNNIANKTLDYLEKAEYYREKTQEQPETSEKITSDQEIKTKKTLQKARKDLSDDGLSL